MINLTQALKHDSGNYVAPTSRAYAARATITGELTGKLTGSMIAITIGAQHAGRIFAPGWAKIPTRPRMQLVPNLLNH